MTAADIAIIALAMLGGLWLAVRLLVWAYLCWDLYRHRCLTWRGAWDALFWSGELW